MKKLFLITALIYAVLCSSCSEEYDDSALWNDLNALEARVTELEELCRQMNTNISSLQTIVNALKLNDYITNVSPVRKEGKIIGIAENTEPMSLKIISPTRQAASAVVEINAGEVKKHAVKIGDIVVF